jgi:hypothetical protein
MFSDDKPRNVRLHWQQRIDTKKFVHFYSKIFSKKCLIYIMPGEKSQGQQKRQTFSYNFLNRASSFGNLSWESPRVIRLGEFLHIGWLFTVGSFEKKCFSSKTFWTKNFHGKSCAPIVTKKWVGLHYGRYFHKPIWSPCLRPTKFMADFTHKWTWRKSG